MPISPVIIASIILGIVMIFVIRLVINHVRAQRIEDNNMLIASKSTGQTVANLSGAPTVENPTPAEETGLAKRLHKAGIQQSSTTYIMIVAAIAIIAFFLSFIALKMPLLSIIAVLGVIGASEWYIRHKIKKQKLLFEEQFGRACSQIAGSIRTGLTIDRAIRSVAAYMEDPLRSEFMIVAAECTYDPDVAGALKRMALRMDSSDAMLFASMIDLNQRRGGRLADSVERLSETISTRQAMRRHIRSETSNGKTTAKAVIGITLLLIGIMFLANPTFPDFYRNEPLGWICLAITVVLFVVGAVIMSKLTDIDMS